MLIIHRTAKRHCPRSRSDPVLPSQGASFRTDGFRFGTGRTSSVLPERGTSSARSTSLRATVWGNSEPVHTFDAAAGRGRPALRSFGSFRSWYGGTLNCAVWFFALSFRFLPVAPRLLAL